MAEFNVWGPRQCTAKPCARTGQPMSDSLKIKPALSVNAVYTCLDGKVNYEVFRLFALLFK